MGRAELSRAWEAFTQTHLRVNINTQAQERKKDKNSEENTKIIKLLEKITIFNNPVKYVPLNVLLSNKLTL